MAITMTYSLDQEAVDQLEALSNLTKKNRSELLREYIKRAYVEATAVMLVASNSAPLNGHGVEDATADPCEKRGQGGNSESSVLGAIC